MERLTREREFERLYQAHAGSLARYALRRAETVEEAEDAVAECFAIIWRRLPDAPREPLPWMYGIARNVLLHQHRSGSRRRALFDRLAREPAADADPHPGDAVSILEALKELPDLDREVLQLVAFEGLDHAACAEVLGCKRATVAVRLYRARSRLRRALADNSPDPIEVLAS